MKKIIQRANRYLLLFNIVTINTIILLNIMSTEFVNKVIDSITVIY